MKDIKTKLDHLRAMQIDTDTLERTNLFDSSCSPKHGVINDMTNLLNKIDLSKLSSKTREEIQGLEKEIVKEVYVYHSPKRRVHIASGTLYIDLIRIKKRLEKERLYEEACFSLEDYKDIGDLYGTDEVLERAYKLIIKLSKEYIEKETTNILQYKLPI